MNIIHNISHSLMACLSLTLSFGVLMHDVRAEHVYATATTSAHMGAYAESEQRIPQRPADDLRTQHTHVDYSSLNNMLTNSFSYQSPSVNPRRDSHHGQLLRMLEIGSRHAFDNANLPLIF